MILRRLAAFHCFCAFLELRAWLPKALFPAEEAMRLFDKTCASRHMSMSGELPDGTRFLDICTPQTPKRKLHFTILSLGRSR